MKIYNQSKSIIKAWQYGDPQLRNISDVIFELIGTQKGMALDVGCGTGRISIQLAKKGFKVDAIDINPEILQMAKEFANEADVKINFFSLDVTKKHDLIRNRRYDLIICSEVLEHVENYKEIISNMYDLLKINGVLIITVPHDSSQYSILDTYGGHLRRYAISQLKQDLNKFRVVDCFTVGFPFIRAFIWMSCVILNINKKHSPEKLWSNSVMKSFYSNLLYKIAKLDNCFNYLNKGTNIICKAVKDDDFIK